jgi:hypothetical protein
MGINIFFLARKQRTPARKLVSHKSARISSLCPGRVLIPLFGPPSIAFILETMLSGPPTHFLTDFPFNVSFYFFFPAIYSKSRNNLIDFIWPGLPGRPTGICASPISRDCYYQCAERSRSDRILP